MRRNTLILFYLLLVLCVAKCSVIVSSVNVKSVSDAFVVEAQPFLNSTEPIILEEDNDDLFYANEPVKYDGAQLWRVDYDDQYKKNIVAALQENFEVTIWNLNQNSSSVDVMIKRQIIEGVRKFLDDSNVKYFVQLDDLQRAIDTENPPQEEIELLQNRKARKTSFRNNNSSRKRGHKYLQNNFFLQLKGVYHSYNSLDPPMQYWPDADEGHRLTWSAYHRLDDIHGFLNYLANTYPDICSVKSIGSSVENRSLQVLRISNGKPTNKAIWLDGGIHAREWISPAVVTYIINVIVEQWEDQPNYIQNTDWYILPVVNPDGYEYTHQFDRLWRKNRGGPGTGRCAGVDLNRNFGYRWGGQGASRQPCTETFAGSSAFSEPESKALKSFMETSAAEFKAYLTFHSYGQYILHPWGYDRSVPPDFKDLDRVGKEAAERMFKLHGAQYAVGPSGSLLYPASGASDDWAKGAIGIKYSYTVELRDSGRYGFLLPASLIEKTSQEAMIFVDTVAKAVSLL